MEMIWEIARGDSIEQLLNAGIVEARQFTAANGDSIAGFAVIGGTLVSKEQAIAGKRENAFGFGHGQRPIFQQDKSGCFLIPEVFVG